MYRNIVAPFKLEPFQQDLLIGTILPFAFISTHIARQKRHNTEYLLYKHRYSYEEFVVFHKREIWKTTIKSFLGYFVWILYKAITPWELPGWFIMIRAIIWFVVIPIWAYKLQSDWRENYEGDKSTEEEKDEFYRYKVLNFIYWVISLPLISLLS